jgi:AraC-like DNA-binding protein
MWRKPFARFTVAPDLRVEALSARFYGHVYDRHFHDGSAVGVTDEGRQVFHARGRRHVSTRGMVIVLTPGEPHDGEAGDASGFAYRMLYLPEALVAELLTEAAERRVGTLMFPDPLLRAPRLARAVSATARAIERSDDSLACFAAVSDLAGVLGATAGAAAPRDVPAREPRAVARARAYLHDRFAEKITLTDLVADAGISRFRLTRAFVAAHGLPPHAYLLSVRLNAARHRLAAGDAAANVAASCGFTDQAHLTREFRRRFGTTPGTYRIAARGRR